MQGTDEDFATALRRALLEAGAVDEMDLARAKRVAHEDDGETLVTLLVKLGMVSERAIADAQARAGKVALVKFADFPVQPLDLPIPTRFLKDQKAIPLHLDTDSLTLAVSDLSNGFTHAAIAFATGKKVSCVVGIESEITRALSTLYDQASSEVRAGENGEADAFSEDDVARLRDLASEAPVIRLVNQIIQKAADSRASDIHIEPYENLLKIRCRIDGVLRDEPSPPRHLAPAVISRLKILANLDIAERRLPQDGRINMRVQGKELDIRVSTVPTMYGESLVMRLLQREDVTLDFDSLGFDAVSRQALQEALRMPHGMIIVTGPTGSGKTTTLYTALSSLNTETRKVITVEDPIEYNLEGINQIQVNPSIGLNFANALRSIVRQDPDVIMVGEMRDLETAKICVQSALTGHLVLSTLHTNDAAGSVTRLLEMGIEDYLLNSTLNMVLAQRLVRRLCDACKQAYQADEAVIREFKLGPPDGSLTLYRAGGCETCGGTGFYGRIGIIEILKLSDDLRQLVLQQASAGELEKAARRNGMKTMFENGCQQVIAGLTTLDEIVRVTQDS